MSGQKTEGEGRGEGTPSPEVVADALEAELAVREACPDWHELSTYQRARSRELFKAGRLFQAKRQANEFGQADLKREMGK